MIISAHQVNFLPYSGFWYKVANADLFDLRYRAQYTQKGYQRRVTMRDNWCSVPVIGNPRFEAINEVRIDLPKAKDQICDTIKGRYSNAPHYKTRGVELVDFIQTLDTGYLWEWNFALLLYVRDVLGITTPFTFGIDAHQPKAEGIIGFLQAYPGADTFLSGRGALSYMEDTSAFDEAGIKVVWSNHKVTTTDSIVSILMDYSDPMEIVMLEKEGDGNG